jgi:predicted GH43/DUF377 family glycosyl hydrolase
VPRRLSSRLLLGPSDLPASREDFDVIGAFNPGAAAVRGGDMLFVRVAERPREERPGYCALPRWVPGKGPEVDWVPEDELEVLDPRVRRRKSDGLVRLTFISHIRILRIEDGRLAGPSGRDGGSLFLPENEYEEFGVEDPRVTFLDGRYYFTYVSVSRHGAATALASTSDFASFSRHGIIFPPENKDVLLFPERFGGEYLAIHRPNPATHFSQPEMWLASSPDLINWGHHRQLYAGGAPWESGRIGGGAPPILTPRGWLEIYHGSRPPAGPGKVGTYAAGAMLLGAQDPGKVLSVTREPVMVPEEEFESAGFVPGVVFPTAAILKDDAIRVYYGAADQSVGMAEFSLKEMLAALPA